MTEHPLISICIPVYNGEKYVAETINSVQAQTYDNIEILIQDNASTDNTGEILQALADQDMRIKVARNDENCGMAGNWNLAVNRAQGDYVMLLSADDLLMPDFLSEGLSTFEMDKVDAVVTNHLFIKSGELSPRKNLTKPGIYQHHSSTILLHNPFSVNFTLFRRALIEELKVNGELFRSFMTCDYDLCIRLSLTDAKITYCHTPLGIYRVHDSNLSKQARKMLRQTVLVVCSHKRALMKSCRLAYLITLFRFLLRTLMLWLRSGSLDSRLMTILRLEIFRNLTGYTNQTRKK